MFNHCKKSINKTLKIFIKITYISFKYNKLLKVKTFPFSDCLYLIDKNSIYAFLSCVFSYATLLINSSKFKVANGGFIAEKSIDFKKVFKYLVAYTNSENII